MNNQDESRQALLRKSNIVIFALTYVIAAIPLSQIIFEPGNLAAPDTTSKILLLSVVLFVFAPFVSIWVIFFRLRVEQALKEKDLWGLLFLSPAPKGSWGNPDISTLLGKKGKKVLRTSFMVFITLTVLAIVLIMLFSN